MTTWFQCRIQYVKILDNDKIKTVTENYLIDAVSFTDAEARLYRSLGSTIPEFFITSVSKTAFKEIFNYDDCENWFKCKVAYVDADEGSGKEKRITSMMLVSASNPKQAYERIEEQLSSWIIPYEITDINTSNIIEVIPYVSEEEDLIKSGQLRSVDKAPDSANSFASIEEEMAADEGEVIEEEEEDYGDFSDEEEEPSAQ
jgi:hypothetical protein